MVKQSDKKQKGKKDGESRKNIPKKGNPQTAAKVIKAKRKPVPKVAAPVARKEKNIVETKNLGISYGEGSARIQALKGINLKIARGEFTAISGPSGSGKSTLLNIIGFLIGNDEGELYFEGNQIKGGDFDRLADFRREKIGFIFQGFNLIPVLSAIENVLVPRAIDGEAHAQDIKRARTLLEAVGLHEHMTKKPDQLSGGQKQRVAIARALVNNPALVLADEPTANLDTKTALSIMELMLTIHREMGTTFLFSTHDDRVLRFAHRRIELRDGVVVQDKILRRS